MSDDRNSEEQAARDLEKFKADLSIEVNKAKAEIDAHYDHWRITADREQQHWRMEWEGTLESNSRMFEAITNYANLALKGVVLVNGGAAIAILVFLGNIWGPDIDGARGVAEALKPSLIAFVVGIIGGVSAAGLSYIAQSLFLEVEKHPWLGQIFRALAAISVAVGLASFTFGSIRAVDAFAASPVIPDASAALSPPQAQQPPPEPDIPQAPVAPAQ